jgi:hypothetical protein
MHRFDTHLVHLLAKFGTAALTTLFSGSIQRLLESGHRKGMEFFYQNTPPHRDLNVGSL